MKKILLIAFVFVALVACKNEKKFTASEVAGTYEGVFPCADCPALNVSLSLNNDSTYNKVESYEKGDLKDETTENGTWTYALESNQIQLSDTQKYKVEKNKLTLLNVDGEPAKGATKDLYTLQKK